MWKSSENVRLNTPEKAYDLKAGMAPPAGLKSGQAGLLFSTSGATTLYYCQYCAPFCYILC